MFPKMLGLFCQAAYKSPRRSAQRPRARKHTHFIPEPCPPAANLVLHAGLHLQMHLAPEHARRGLPEGGVHLRLRVEREVGGGQPTVVPVAPGRDAVDFGLGVECECGARFAYWVSALHQHDWMEL